MMPKVFQSTASGAPPAFHGFFFEILQVLNPLLTNYVDTNKITLVIEKKNILVGIKTLDITDKIIQILNAQTKEQNLLNEN